MLPVKTGFFSGTPNPGATPAASATPPRPTTLEEASEIFGRLSKSDKLIFVQQIVSGYETGMGLYTDSVLDTAIQAELDSRRGGSATREARQ